MRLSKPKAPRAKRPLPRVKARHVATLGVLALAGFTVSNAVLLQPERHPAPYFNDDERAIQAALKPTGESHVRALQSRLQAMGHYEGPLDGQMDEMTLASVFDALDTPAQAASRPTSPPRAAVAVRDANGMRAVGGGPIPAPRAAGPSPVNEAASHDDLIGTLLAERAPAVPTVQTTRLDGPAQTTDATPASSAHPVIAAVQQQLAARGYQPGPVDGVMGTGTRTALRAYQSENGLTASGELDAATLTALGLSGA